MNIFWLDDARCQDVAQVGGKAAQLSRLVGQYNVPMGFCLTTIAFDIWQNGQEEGFPKVLKTELQEVYDGLAQKCGQEKPMVAVRSSAVEEDGTVVSFAGVHETVLNVCGVNALMDAVVQCWQSALSSAALAYRREHRLDTDNIRMAVLVQEMVDADMSVVAFGVDPSTGDQRVVTLNACLGLGDVMMDGRVMPDTFVVQKLDGCVVSQTGVGTVLCDSQVNEVVQCVMSLESELGYAVDIEGAFKNGVFHLLQCRPITTLADQEVAHVTGDFDVMWDCEEDVQATWKLEGEASKPFDQLQRVCYVQGFRKAGRDVDFGDRGRPNKGRTQNRLFVNGFRYGRQKPSTPQMDVPDEGMRKAEQRLGEQKTAALWPQWTADIRARVDGLTHRDWDRVPDDALPNALLNALEVYSEYGRLHAHIIQASYPASSRLINWYEEQFPDASEREAYGLLQGIPNMSTEKGHRLWLLAQMATPSNIAALEKECWEDLDAPFRDALERFCRDFYERNFADVAPFVCLYVEHQIPNPLIVIEKLVQEREVFTERVREQIEGVQERKNFEEMLAMAKVHYPLTEDHGYWLDLGCKAALRVVQDAFGNRLKALGVLDGVEDVVFLTVDELLRWGWGVADPLGERVRKRKAQFEENKRMKPPEFLGVLPETRPKSSNGGGDYYWGPAEPLEANAGELKGIGASAGVVRGRARVVKENVADALVLQPGEILVCDEPWVTWTALFAIAGALVTDVGGSLCHGAVVAREYRLPAVVGTHNATEKICTGQEIEVDGAQGVVRLVMG